MPMIRPHFGERLRHGLVRHGREPRRAEERALGHGCTVLRALLRLSNLLPQERRLSVAVPEIETACDGDSNNTSNKRASGLWTASAGNLSSQSHVEHGRLSPRRGKESGLLDRTP